MRIIDEKLIKITPSLLFLLAAIVFFTQITLLLIQVIANLRAGQQTDVLFWLELLHRLALTAFQPAILIALAVAIVHLGRMAKARPAPFDAQRLP